MPEADTVQVHAARTHADATARRRALVRVENGFSVIAGREVYAIWDGSLPIVPAIVYLHSLDDESSNTVRRAAYALLDVFRWLATQDFTFWEFSEARVQLYRVSLKRRVHLSETPQRPDADSAQGRATAKRRREESIADGGPICRATANAYLAALYYLLRHWGAADAAPPPHAGPRVRDRGSLAHLTFVPEQRPKLFRIRTRPRNRRRIRRGLPPLLLARVWAALERAKPRPSKVLSVPAVTPKQRERRRRAEIAYARRRLLFYRNKALWGFLLATGCRIGEVVRVRTIDVDRATGYLHLQERPEDAHLGQLKTGPDDIFFGFHDRYLAHLDEWEMHGQAALHDLRRMLGADAAPAHAMLFSSAKTGGPLRQPAIRRLFKRLYRACGLRAANVKFSPHITRHTIATMLKSAGVPIHVRQASLRHSRAETTDQYGHMNDPVVRDGLNRFWSGLGRVAAHPA